MPAHAPAKAGVEQVLLPTLAPGDIVIMDNLDSHKRHGIRRLIRPVAANLFLLPPYSPDLTPIEQVFAKLNTLLRRGRRTNHRGRLETHRLPPRLLHPAECANYPKNSRSASTIGSHSKLLLTTYDDDTTARDTLTHFQRRRQSAN